VNTVLLSIQFMFLRHHFHPLDLPPVHWSIRTIALGVYRAVSQQSGITEPRLDSSVAIW